MIGASKGYFLEFIRVDSIKFSIVLRKKNIYSVLRETSNVRNFHSIFYSNRSKIFIEINDEPKNRRDICLTKKNRMLLHQGIHKINLIAIHVFSIFTVFNFHVLNQIHSFLSRVRISNISIENVSLHVAPTIGIY